MSAFSATVAQRRMKQPLKLVRKARGKSKIMTFQHSFHGRTYGAMSATGQAAIHAGFAPLVPDFHYGVFNDFR